MEPSKITRPVTLTFDDLPAPWSACNGITVAGYEIRNGRIHTLEPRPVTDGARWWSDGSVLATTVHGLLEHPDLLSALFGRTPAARTRTDL